MDFAIIDAENWKKDQGIHLLNSDIIIKDSDISNPIICIANYFFDSLQQDAYSIESESGELYEWKMKIKASCSPNDNSFLSTVIDNTSISWKREYIQEYNENRSNSDGPYVFESYLNEILQLYQKTIGIQGIGGSFVLPIGSLRLLNQLKEFSNNRLFLISGDKADAFSCEFNESSKSPDITNHQGCFSFTTNFDAIGKYFENNNGFILREHFENQFRVCIFVMEALDELDFPILSSSYRSSLQFGPEHYFNLFKGSRFLNKHYKILKKIGKPKKHSLKREIALQEYLNSVLSQLSLSNYDSDLFMQYYKGIAACCLYSDSHEQKQLRILLRRIWDNDYYIPNLTSDVGLAIAEILQLLNHNEAAIQFLLISEKRIFVNDDKLSKFYNIANSYLEINDISNSLVYFRKCHELDPEDDEFIEQIQILENDDSLNTIEDTIMNIKISYNTSKKTREDMLLQSQRDSMEDINFTLSNRCKKKYT